MRLSILSALAAAALLAACSSDVPVNDAGGAGSGNTASTADTSGIAGQATPGSKGDFDQNVGNTVYFDLDSYSVRADASPLLDAQAAWLVRYPYVQIRIEGNADERGTREYNLALGARRAEAVRSYLISRGVPAARIDTISFGKERPIAEGSNESAWAQNRNARTAIVSGAPR